jgi:hypothetical protein
VNDDRAAFGFEQANQILRNTDLPVPEGPIKTLISPGGSVSVTSDQTVDWPKDFRQPLHHHLDTHAHGPSPAPRDGEPTGANGGIPRGFRLVRAPDASPQPAGIVSSTDATGSC